MPYLLPSQYRPPRLLRNGHAQTLYANLIRHVSGIVYRRERIDTVDQDFIDLDWSEVGNGPVAIIVHGLEGNSQQRYMVGMTRALNVRGINVVNVNLRGCSGELNRNLGSYHCGSTEDIELVSAHVSRLHPASTQFLVGFSLGGNLILKYLGERGSQARPQIEAAVAFSVPGDLRSCATKVNARSNRLYFHQFMLSIQLKLREKNRQFPGQIDPNALRWTDSFKEFNEHFTIRVWGFSSTEEYWDNVSSNAYLRDIRVPSLIVNAKDDPLLTDECYPVDVAAESSYVYLEAPEHGGHVGFVSFNSQNEYWSESRAAQFLLKKR